MVKLSELVTYTNSLLNISQYKDYCPNGLQIEGKTNIETIVSGVTANLALVDAAIEMQADAVIVHHGYFWKGDSPQIIGMQRRRLHRFLTNDLSLLAYHLPLDDHISIGNNAQIGDLLGFKLTGKFGFGQDVQLGCYGVVDKVLSPVQFAQHISRKLGRTALHIAGSATEINQIAWCTGAAQSYLSEAVALGVDAFITGEISEQTVHIARETGVHFYSAGHHATERYGVKALGEHLAGHFALQHHFIDIDNPV